MQVNPQPLAQQQMVAPTPTLRPAADPTPPFLLHPIQTQLPKLDVGSPSTDPCSTPRGSPIITSPTDSAIFGTPVTTPRASLDPSGSGGQHQPPPSPHVIRSPLLHFITNPNPNASPLMKPMSQLTMRSPLPSPKGHASPMRLSGASRITSSGITLLERGAQQQQQQISEEDIHDNNMNNNNGYYSPSASIQRVGITKSSMSPEDRNNRSGAVKTMMTMMMSGKEREEADQRREQQQQYHHQQQQQMASSPGCPCARRALPFARSTGAYPPSAYGDDNDGTANNNNGFGTYTWSPSRSPSLTLAGSGGGRGATPNSPIAVAVAGKLNFGANIREPSFSDFLKSDRESSAGLQLTMQLTTTQNAAVSLSKLVPSPLKRTTVAAGPPGVRRRLLDSINSIGVTPSESSPCTSPTQKQALPQLRMAVTKTPVSLPTAAAGGGRSMMVHHPPLSSSTDTPRKRARKGAPYRAPIDDNDARFGSGGGATNAGKSDAVSGMEEDGVAAATSDDDDGR